MHIEGRTKRLATESLVRPKKNRHLLFCLSLLFPHGLCFLLWVLLLFVPAGPPVSRKVQKLILGEVLGRPGHETRCPGTLWKKSQDV